MCLTCARRPLPSLRGFGFFHVYELVAKVDALDFVLHCGGGFFVCAGWALAGGGDGFPRERLVLALVWHWCTARAAALAVVVIQ